MQALNLILQLAPDCGDAVEVGSGLGQPLLNVSELGLGGAPAPVRLLQKRARFLQLSVKGVGAALGEAEGLASLGACPLLFLELNLMGKGWSERAGHIRW